MSTAHLHALTRTLQRMYLLVVLSPRRGNRRAVGTALKLSMLYMALLLLLLLIGMLLLLPLRVYVRTRILHMLSLTLALLLLLLLVLSHLGGRHLLSLRVYVRTLLRERGVLGRSSVVLRIGRRGAVLMYIRVCTLVCVGVGNVALVLLLLLWGKLRARRPVKMTAAIRVRRRRRVMLRRLLAVRRRRLLIRRSATD